MKDIMPRVRHTPAAIPKIPINDQRLFIDNTAKRIDNAISKTINVPVILKKSEEIFMCKLS